MKLNPFLLMCPDEERARINREIVSKGLFTEYYDRLKRWLENTSRHDPLPAWVSIGQVPEVQSKAHSGSQRDEND